MKYTKLKENYEALVNDIRLALENEIRNSSIQSKHYDAKAIKVNIFGYTELILLDNRFLIFLDKDGYQYSIDAECELEDLLNILSTF